MKTSTVILTVGSLAVLGGVGYYGYRQGWFAKLGVPAPTPKPATGSPGAPGTVGGLLSSDSWSDWAGAGQSLFDRFNPGGSGSKKDSGAPSNPSNYDPSFDEQFDAALNPDDGSQWQ